MANIENESASLYYAREVYNKSRLNNMCDVLHFNYFCSNFQHYHADNGESGVIPSCMCLSNDGNYIYMTRNSPTISQTDSVQIMKINISGEYSGTSQFTIDNDYSTKDHTGSGGSFVISNKKCSNMAMLYFDGAWKCSTIGYGGSTIIGWDSDLSKASILCSSTISKISSCKSIASDGNYQHEIFCRISANKVEARLYNTSTNTYDIKRTITLNSIIAGSSDQYSCTAIVNQCYYFILSNNGRGMYVVYIPTDAENGYIANTYKYIQFDTLMQIYDIDKVVGFDIKSNGDIFICGHQRYNTDRAVNTIIAKSNIWNNSIRRNFFDSSTYEKRIYVDGDGVSESNVSQDCFYNSRNGINSGSPFAHYSIGILAIKNLLKSGCISSGGFILITFDTSLNYELIDLPECNITFKTFNGSTTIGNLSISNGNSIIVDSPCHTCTVNNVAHAVFNKSVTTFYVYNSTVLYSYSNTITNYSANTTIPSTNNNGRIHAKRYSYTPKARVNI